MIRVDEAGHIAEALPRPKANQAPAPHLVSLLRRTVSMLGAGSFGLDGTQKGEGAEVLALHAVVHDLHGETPPAGGWVDLAFAFDRGHGQASFTHGGGRRVEVSVDVVKSPGHRRSE